ncbi:MAG: hypothetical protein IJ565_02530 [Bacilli bacterium]|nr:hypothetical protein [Bacilli bacterium]
MQGKKKIVIIGTMLVIVVILAIIYMPKMINFSNNSNPIIEDNNDISENKIDDSNDIIEDEEEKKELEKELENNEEKKEELKETESIVEIKETPKQNTTSATSNNTQTSSTQNSNSSTNTNTSTSSQTQPSTPTPVEQPKTCKESVFKSKEEAVSFGEDKRKYGTGYSVIDYMDDCGKMYYALKITFRVVTPGYTKTLDENQAIAFDWAKYDEDTLKNYINNNCSIDVSMSYKAAARDNKVLEYYQSGFFTAESQPQCYKNIKDLLQ